MPAVTAEEWRNGANEQLERISLQPEGMKSRTAGAVAGMARGAGFVKLTRRHRAESRAACSFGGTGGGEGAQVRESQA